jgi:putative transposase
MIVRTLKLRLNKSQEKQLEQWLWNLTGLYNWGLKKIEYGARDKIFYSTFGFVNLIAEHSKRMEIPSHTMQGTLQQVYSAWQRCFKKIAKKPKLKGQRNKLNSIPFPDPIRPPKDNKIGIPGLGKVRYHKQELPNAKIKCGRILKKASGWYLCLWLDTDNKFQVKDTDKVVGIDPGFSTLLTLSDGIKIENPRELRKEAKRLAQAQRGHNKKLTSRLQERQANRRNDRNHKISRWLVENYKTIYYSDDNFKSMAKTFGKSVTEAGLGDLISKTSYKSKVCGRSFKPVNSKNTTMTCSTCGSLTGPTGLSGLAVRHWICSACGVQHDRDFNSSQVVFNVGAGIALEKELRHVA